MGTKMANNGQFNTGNSGSTVNSIYGKRNMKVYPVYEQEMDILGYFNSAALIFFSIGSFFLSPLLDIFQKWFDKKDVLIGSGTAILLVMAISFYVAGAVSLFFRHGVVKKIKKQSEEIKD